MKIFFAILTYVFTFIIDPGFCVAKIDDVRAYIFYHGYAYRVDKNINRKEKIINEDLDKDGIKDLIRIEILYATFEEKIARPFYLIYDYKRDKLKPIFTVKGNMVDGEIEVINIDKKTKGLLLLSYGGNHYTNIFICKYQRGRIISLLEEGSPCPIVLDEEGGFLIVKIGRSNWGSKVKDKDGREYEWCFASEPLWEVYRWNGEKFVYSKELSTVSKRGEEGEFRAFLQYWGERYKSDTDILKGLLIWTFGAKLQDFNSLEFPQDF